MQNGTDPMSKVLKFPRGSLKETAPPPDSKRRVKKYVKCAQLTVPMYKLWPDLGLSYL